MSHVIRTPNIVDATSGDTILRFGDSGYDATIDWGEDGGFDIALRHYWRAGTLRLTVDRAAGSFRIAGADAGSPAHPLDDLGRFIEAHFSAADREAAARAAGLSLQEMKARNRQRRTRVMVAVLALAVAAMVWAMFLRR